MSKACCRVKCSSSTHTETTNTKFDWKNVYKINVTEITTIFTVRIVLSLDYQFKRLRKHTVHGFTKVFRKKSRGHAIINIGITKITE